MTTLLETAFEKVSALSEMEQNIYAKNLLNVIGSEKRWDSAFSESEDLLGQMADSAVEDFQNNNTKPLTQDQF